jgi:hypothetical protein
MISTEETKKLLFEVLEKNGVQPYHSSLSLTFVKPLFLIDLRFEVLDFFDDSTNNVPGENLDKYLQNRQQIIESIQLDLYSMIISTLKKEIQTVDWSFLPAFNLIDKNGTQLKSELIKGDRYNLYVYNRPIEGSWIDIYDQMSSNIIRLIILTLQPNFLTVNPPNLDYLQKRYNTNLKRCYEGELIYPNKRSN